MAWALVRGSGPAWARCEALGEVPGIAHAFGTRRGADGVDVDFAAPGSETELRSLCEAAGLRSAAPLQLRQVHGRRVLRVRGASRPAAMEGDGFVASEDDRPAFALAVRCADCVPLLIAEREGRAVAAVHAGWRGTAAGIAARAVSALATLGAAAENLVVALGPAIGGCCYRVGPEVVEAVAAATGGAGEPPARRSAGGLRLDLRAALRLQLEAAGVLPGAIHSAPWCTHCEKQTFFSYRREGAGCGRQVACVGWAGVA